MENNYEITEKQLAFLEGYIKRKKKFTEPEDVYELMDHLINDFEATTEDGNLSQYLSTKSHFIFKYTGSRKNKEEAIHWEYQRELYKQFFSFFHRLKYLPFTALLFTFLYLFFIQFSFSNKVLAGVFASLIALPMITGYVITYHKNKKIKKLVSFKYLANIMLLPMLFLQCFNLISDFLKENRFLFLTYTFIGVILCFSAIIVVLEKRKEILKKYKHLLQ
ncbi:hypothetical protein [Tenacibaculum retecalamus]|uniref:hypothetical protein n=1 Tax=Tenacibaculum retecalamus TaxID=3018315 RepID=UPI0023D90CF1|nr:hypothetical protein [Tenacibaculum retecalamus]WBX71337.1 hypothetical protein PG912_00580 [Tenacibaculum retecalamus]